MATTISPESLLKKDVKYLLTNSYLPINERMSALFDARKLGDLDAVEYLLEGLSNDKKKEKPSILFQHEVAYVLGQIGNPAALNKLMLLVEDVQEDEMVRHEAAEALAAIGSAEAIDCLKKFVYDNSLPVGETCQLALRSLLNKVNSNEEIKNDLDSDKDNKKEEEKKAEITTNENESSINTNNQPSSLPNSQNTQEELPNRSEGSPFYSVDPVSALKNVSEKDIPQLRTLLLNPKTALWDRYEALFSLRNINSLKSIEAINESLIEDKTSALFRHEVAFVLGQIQHSSSSKALIECLENKDEHCMARHEAALAMGSIAASISSEDTLEDKFDKIKLVKSLNNNLLDHQTIVYESCEVALKNICEEIDHSDPYTLLSNPLFSQS